MSSRRNTDPEEPIDTLSPSEDEESPIESLSREDWAVLGAATLLVIVAGGWYVTQQGDEPVPATTQSAEIELVAFNTTDNVCGARETNTATINDAGDRVIVEGTFGTATRCHGVHAQDMERTGPGQYRLIIHAHPPEGDGCTDCEGKISYRAALNVAESVETLDVVYEKTGEPIRALATYNGDGAHDHVQTTVDTITFN